MNTLVGNKMKGLTTFDLKMIGVVLMFIDHIHQMFVPMGAPNWLDWFGRPVATLFFFVTVVGFSYTRSKEKYLLRLYSWMILMTVGSFIIETLVGYEEVQLTNNIFRDLLVGSIMMYGLDKIATGFLNKKIDTSILGIIIVLFPIITSLALTALMMNPSTIMISVFGSNVVPSLVFTENNSRVLLIPLMYVTRKYRWLQCLLIVLASVYYLSLEATQWMMIFSIIPIALFNGRKGKEIKNFFYFFYPLHIWILYLISAYIYMH